MLESVDINSTEDEFEEECNSEDIIIDPLKVKFQALEDELQKTIAYTDRQINSIDTTYEEKLKQERKFSEGIFNAKRNMLEQKLKAIQQLFQIYEASRKSDEDSGKGRDITDFIS